MIVSIKQEKLTVPEQVAEYVRGLISRRALKRGDPLPSYRELASDLNVALFTAKRGVDILADQGIVRRQVGQGCFVNREVVAGGQPLRTIGIVHAASQKHLFSAPYLAQILRGLHDGPQPHDMHVFTMREHGFVTAAQLADRQIDGAILLGIESDAFLREFTAWRVPGVVVDQCAEDVPLDSVVCDNEAGTQQAVQHLTKLGHRRIRYVGRDPHRTVLVDYHRNVPLETRSSDSMERRAAVGRALSDIPGIRWDEAILFTQGSADARPSSSDGVKAVVATWMRESDRPTAFLTDSDSLAFDLIQELAKKGVSVPGDVSVCATAGAGVPGADGVRVTQSCFDFVGMGRKALKLLRLRCEQPVAAPAPAVYRIGCQFDTGTTLAAVSRNIR